MGIRLGFTATICRHVRRLCHRHDAYIMRLKLFKLTLTQDLGPFLWVVKAQTVKTAIAKALKEFPGCKVLMATEPKEGDP